MSNYALGLMSGTSMDGIDAAVMNVHNGQLVLGQTFPYPAELSEKLTSVMQGKAFDMCFFAALNREVGQAFASVAKNIVQQFNEPLCVVGSHGQTICHQIQPKLSYTWQIGCPYTLYQALKTPVVFDFRSHNVVQGGQGAPLAPLFHQHLWGCEDFVAVINIGGISNISLIRHGFPLAGYDIGPGNCLSDAWIAEHLAEPFDIEGRWASKGQISLELFERLKADDFFQKKYPKSIGKEYFSLTWLKQHLNGLFLHSEDVQATLIYLTAYLIAEEIKQEMPLQSRVYICGGGVKNKVLMQHLRHFLSSYEVQSTDDVGISSDFLEAMMIAWLAWCRMQNIHHDVSSIMGGNNHQLLGLIVDN